MLQVVRVDAQSGKITVEQALQELAAITSAFSTEVQQGLRRLVLGDLSLPDAGDITEGLGQTLASASRVLDKTLFSSAAPADATREKFEAAVSGAVGTAVKFFESFMARSQQRKNAAGAAVSGAAQLTAADNKRMALESVDDAMDVMQVRLLLACAAS